MGKKQRLVAHWPAGYEPRPNWTDHAAGVAAQQLEAGEYEMRIRFTATGGDRLPAFGSISIFADPDPIDAAPLTADAPEAPR